MVIIVEKTMFPLKSWLKSQSTYHVGWPSFKTTSSGSSIPRTSLMIPTLKVVGTILQLVVPVG